MNAELTQQEPQSEHAPNETYAQSDINIVGIGASAGGIHALQSFFTNTPADSSMAFVVILHLPPHLESNVAQILQHVTEMPVMQVTEPTRVEVNHIYVIPPNQHLSMRDGTIELQDPDGMHTRRAPIDLFFRTLADTHGCNAAAVVLSGSGADGTVGVQRIKENGGAVLAQDPAEAEFSAMPRNVIATGLVDAILPVAEMPAMLTHYWQTAAAVRLPVEPAPADADADLLGEIFALLRARTGHDFSQYKRATLLRRIGRRMQVNVVTDVQHYLQVLRSRPDEVQALLRDLLISVTNFFRDPEAWRALAAIIPNLFANKEVGDQVRVWVAGCATGEEAYTIAMLLYEHASTLGGAPNIQVFATDIDEEAINTARQGSYPETIAADVAPERLQRFFVPEQGRYRVRKEIRDMVLFAPHNLVRDPPFSKLDLITCRNLLIYLNREVQEQVLQLFHFVLLPAGYLLLGESESSDSAPGLFTPIDKTQRLFQSQAAPSTLRGAIPSLPLAALAQRTASSRRNGHEKQSPSFTELDQHVLARYGPPRVIVNQDYDIVHLAHGAGRFLTLADGEVSANLMKMAHPDLRLELRNALFTAVQRGESAETRWLHVDIDGAARLVHMLVQSIREPEWASGYLLVLFHDIADTGPVIRSTVADVEPMMQQLEEELQRTKEQLRTTIEQYETAVEEYKAANEELQAINEELRAATAELETSKEELQSVNEELITVNQELKLKVDEVTQSNNDLLNLMASTEIGTIFVDRTLRVRRYTSSAQTIFNMIPADLNRPLAHITHRLDYPQIVDDVAGVLETCSRVEREVPSEDGRWYLARLLPYRTIEDTVEGVIIAFIEITERRQAEQELRESEEKYRALIDVSVQIIWTTDAAGMVVEDSPSWRAFTGQTLAEWQGDGWRNAVHPDDRAYADAQWQQSVASSVPLNATFRLHKESDGWRWAHVRAVPLRNADGAIRGWVGMNSDVTEQKNNELALQQARDVLEQRVVERTAELEHANARLQELLRALLTAQEDERRRLARELHDQLGQQLSALRLNLAALADQYQIGSAVNGYIERLQQIAGALDNDVDQLVYNLRPSGLDDFGLHVALQQHVDAWGEQHSVPVELQILDAHQRVLSPDLETVVYRVVQEALTNVAKHAQAQHVSVILEHRADQVRVIVEDDGDGFDGDAPRNATDGSHRLGVSGMRERVESAGGTVTLESEQGSGTTVYVRIPLPGAGEGGVGT